jgi:hypothetical protein
MCIRTIVPQRESQIYSFRWSLDTVYMGTGQEEVARVDQDNSDPFPKPYHFFYCLALFSTQISLHYFSHGLMRMTASQYGIFRRNWTTDAKRTRHRISVHRDAISMMIFAVNPVKLAPVGRSQNLCGNVSCGFSERVGARKLVTNRDK